MILKILSTSNIFNLSLFWKIIIESLSIELKDSPLWHIGRWSSQVNIINQKGGNDQLYEFGQLPTTPVQSFGRTQEA